MKNDSPNTALTRLCFFFFFFWGGGGVLKQLVVIAATLTSSALPLLNQHPLYLELFERPAMSLTHSSTHSA